MDLKPLYLAITFLSAGAGFLTAWLETRGRKDEAPKPPPLPSYLVQDGTRGLGERGAPEERGQFSPTRRTRDAGGESETGSSSPGGGRAANESSATNVDGARESEPRAATSAALRVERDALNESRALLEEGSFDAAILRAGKLLHSTSPEIASEARRIVAISELLPFLLEGCEAKAKLAGAGDEIDGEENESDTPRYEILLANGARFLAASAKEGTSEWTVRLGKKDVRTLPLEDVASVREIEPAATGANDTSKPPAVRESEPTPTEIFVKRCAPLLGEGRGSEALEILDSLLARRDGETVALELAPEKELELVIRLWREAAAPLIVQAARDPSPSRPAVSHGDETAQAAVLTPAQAAEALDRARRLVDEARAMYRAAFGKEGREDELVESYEILREAQTLLDALGATDEVRALRRDLSQLIFDVERSLPFGHR